VAILRAFPELRRGRRATGATNASPERADGDGTAPRRRGGRRRRRNMSPEARKRISNAQKARWAKFHANAGSKGVAPTGEGRKKR
jgi:hypothetical protein